MAADLSNIEVGNVVLVTWQGTLFDPDAYVRPDETTPNPDVIASIGFVSEKTKGKLSLSLDGMYEGNCKHPTFRTVLAIPASIILTATVLGKIPASDEIFKGL